MSKVTSVSRPNSSLPTIKEFFQSVLLVFFLLSFFQQKPLCSGVQLPGIDPTLYPVVVRGTCEFSGTGFVYEVLP